METDPLRNSRLRLVRADESWEWAPSSLPVVLSKSDGKIADASENSCDLMRRSRLHIFCR